MSDSDESSGTEKPKIEFVRPGKPGGALMWAGAGVVLLSVVAFATCSDRDNSGDAARAAAVAAALEAEQAGAQAESERFDKTLAATQSAIAASDSAVAANNRGDVKGDMQSVELNGVIVEMQATPAWQSTRSGRQVMWKHSESNVLCQLSARSDAEPGGLQKDTAGDEAAYEAEYMKAALPLPGTTRAATTLFRESGAAEYRYAVRIKVTAPPQIQIAAFDVVNGVAQAGAHMARLQCVSRDMRPADMSAAEALVGSLHAK